MIWKYIFVYNLLIMLGMVIQPRENVIGFWDTHVNSNYQIIL